MTQLSKSESLTLDLMITTMNDEINEVLVDADNYEPGDISEMQSMYSLLIKLRDGATIDGVSYNLSQPKGGNA